MVLRAHAARILQERKEEARLLVMDEPTAALADHEIEAMTYLLSSAGSNDRCSAPLAPNARRSARPT